jgi:plasmid stabilization system protein ParE
MSKKIRRRARARQDLVDIFRYYAREAGFRVARRFFAQFDRRESFTPIPYT